MAIPYEKILPKMEEARFIRNHGRVLGNAVHVVTPQGDITAMRIIPTITGGDFNAVLNNKSLVWGSIQWVASRQEWACVVHNLPENKGHILGTIKYCHSLKGAMRFARKAVNIHAPVIQGETSISVEPLTSPYPSESDYIWTLNYFDSLDSEETERS